MKKREMDIVIARCYNSIAEAHLHCQKYDSALHYLDRSREILRSNQSNIQVFITCLYLCGRTYAEQSNLDSAISSYEEALSILSNRVDVDTCLKANILEHSGDAYFHLQQNESAYECYRKSLYIRQQTGDEFGVDVERSLEKFGRIRQVMGNYYLASITLERCLAMRKTNHGSKSKEVGKNL